MKKWIVVGALALAVGVGVAGYGLAGAQGDEGPERVSAESGTAERPARPKRPLAEPVPAPEDGGPPAAVTKKIERVEIGMAYAEVLAILGPADWEEEQSTDFGEDVILWYSGWAVYLTNQSVRTVDYYGVDV
jgi:hypothetical protein